MASCRQVAPLPTGPQQQPDLHLHLIQLKTIDSFQGRESNIVILDLPVVSSLGFMREVIDDTTDKQSTASGPVRTPQLSRSKYALYIIGNYKAMDRPNLSGNRSLAHSHRVPVPDELTITPPDTAVEEQNDVQASGSWNENGMELDGTAAQPGASDNNPTTGGGRLQIAKEHGLSQQPAVTATIDMTLLRFFNFCKRYIELGGKYTTLCDIPASYDWFVGARAPKSIDECVVEKEELFRIPAATTARQLLPGGR
ncbi:uncharacterized protein P174DRAFT_507221 [Aspergillus novofumigatus IBT 16806]|uniref:Uncharacterized protein n=1 Tax=Aspergillus novofumigatus (strain IBT 16806) TaxID=1392255 RepID=A0A2I1BVX7_ASPN1|nr:uncharacterized protein P174DRAFT_507221 [Aspergillus novofumigatus IBT 16806]PKX89516.1 hypothetical protein P174DRAFT_507221 [Aspergillus novofumigatus IBT 16806]